MSIGEPYEPWHALRNAVLDHHPARDRLSVVQRERFDTICRELWARLGATPDGIEHAGVVARVGLDLILRYSPPATSPVTVAPGQLAHPDELFAAVSRNESLERFRPDELRLALDVAYARGATVEAAVIGYELGRRQERAP